MNRERRDFVKGAGMAVAAAAVAGQVGPAAAQPKPVYEIYAAKYAGPFITDLIAWMETYDKVRAKASAVDLCFQATTQACCSTIRRLPRTLPASPRVVAEARGRRRVLLAVPAILLRDPGDCQLLGCNVTAF